MTALYLRLSIDDGPDRESNSIGNQRDILTRYANEYGFTELEEYIDDGYSGVSFNRPGFQKLIKDIEGDRISTILVKDLSRFGRNSTLVAYYVDIIFTEYNVRLIAVNDNIDTAAEHDELILPIKSILNEMYVKEASKKSRATNKQRAERGEWLGSKPPYGYRRSTTRKNRLEVDPEKAATVREIFRMADESFDLRRIGRQIDLNITAIRSILGNPIYTGNTISRRYATISLKVKKKVDESEWIRITGTHEALVDEETFNRVQEWIKRKMKAPSQEGEGVSSLYKGLLVCAACGVPLIPDKAGRYKCPRCAKTIHENTLTVRVLDHIKRAPEVITSIPSSLTELRREESDLRVKTKQAIERSAIGALTDDAMSNILDECKRRRAEIERKIEKAEVELVSARCVAGVSPYIELTRDTICKLIDRITVSGAYQCEIKFKEATS